MKALWLRSLTAALFLFIPAICFAVSPLTETTQARNLVTEGLLSHTTGLLFPARIGTLTRFQVVDYEEQYPGRGLGTGYRYRNEAGLRIDIFLYDYRQQVPEGVDAPLVRSEAQRSSGEVDTLQARGFYEDVQHTPMEICRPQAIEFFCAAMSFTIILQRPQGGKLPSMSMLLLRGMKGHFLKLRITWPYGSAGLEQEGKAFVDAFLQAQQR